MEDEQCGEWKAWLDRMPGGKPTLHVTCMCGFPTTGYTVVLERHEPQGTNERDLLLELHIHEPGGITLQVLTEVKGEYSEQTDMGYETVSIVPNGPTGVPVTITT